MAKVRKRPSNLTRAGGPWASSVCLLSCITDLILCRWPSLHPALTSVSLSWPCPHTLLLSLDCLLLQAPWTQQQPLCWRGLAHPDSAGPPCVWESGILFCQGKAELETFLVPDSPYRWHGQCPTTAWNCLSRGTWALSEVAESGVTGTQRGVNEKTITFCMDGSLLPAHLRRALLDENSQNIRFWQDP